MSDEGGEMPDMDPKTAAQYAMGETEQPGQSADTSVFDRLFDGSARGPPAQKIQSEYGLNKPLSLLTRGIVRLSDSEGIPPAGEIAVGAGLGLKQFTEKAKESEDNSEDDMVLSEL